MRLENRRMKSYSNRSLKNSTLALQARGGARKCSADRTLAGWENRANCSDFQR